MNYQNKTVVITGAPKGIGASCARLFYEAGAKVALLDIAFDDFAINEERRLNLLCDVSVSTQVKAVMDNIKNHFGSIDILVNNAGLQRDAKFHEMTLAQWQLVIDVNLTGQFLCAREAIREFLRRGFVPERSVGCVKIICISSVHELIHWGGHAKYASSKGGITVL